MAYFLGHPVYDARARVCVQTGKAAMTDAVERMRSQVDTEAEHLTQQLASHTSEVLRRLDEVTSQLQQQSDALHQLITRCTDVSLHKFQYTLLSSSFIEGHFARRKGTLSCTMCHKGLRKK